MRQNEVRTTEHNHTPSSKARQPGRHKKQPDTQRRDQRRNWARTPQGTNRRGKGSNNRQGRGADKSQTKDRHKETQHPQKGARRPRKDTRKRAGRNTNTTKTPPTRGHAREEAKHKTKDKRRQGEHSRIKTAPNQPTKLNKRGAKRGRNPTEARKKTPLHRSKWEQIAMWCPGTEGTGDKRQKRDNKTEGRGEGRGGSLRQTPCSIFKVVLFICSESVSPAVPIAKETGLVLSSPAAWSRSSLHLA